MNTIEMIKNVDADDYKEYKEFMELIKPVGENEDHEGIKKAKEKGYKIGKKVCIFGDIYGVIVGYNQQVGGLYDGVRYPIMVKRDHDDLIFEYSLIGVKLLEGEQNDQD